MCVCVVTTAWLLAVDRSATSAFTFCGSTSENPSCFNQQVEATKLGDFVTPVQIETHVPRQPISILDSGYFSCIVFKQN